MLIDEENIMLEASIEMSLETKFPDDRVVVAIDVCVDTVHPLEYLANHAWERLGKWYTWKQSAHCFWKDSDTYRSC